MAVPLGTGGHHPQGDQPTIWRAPSQETAPTTRCNGRLATSSLVCVPAALRECRVLGLHAQTGNPRGRPSRGTAGTNPKTGGHQPKDWQALPFNNVGDHEFFLAFGKCVSEVVRGSFILVWGYVGIGRRVPVVLSCYSLRFSLHSLFFLTLCQLRSCHRQFCSIRTARSNFRSCFSRCVGTSGCQLCHFRLNGPVRGLEDNMLRDMDSPDSRRFACTVRASTLPGQSCFGISLLVIGYSDVRFRILWFCRSQVRCRVYCRKGSMRKRRNCVFKQSLRHVCLFSAECGGTPAGGESVVHKLMDAMSLFCGVPG